MISKERKNIKPKTIEKPPIAALYSKSKESGVAKNFYDKSIFRKIRFHSWHRNPSFRSTGFSWLVLRTPRKLS
ncbi:MAG TPA: hypothetical protein PKD18_19215, partial [Saprospiraceae bacterium]|nr:hypothetical protein [Saprospiraceae bacterium]